MLSLANTPAEKQEGYIYTAAQLMSPSSSCKPESLCCHPADKISTLFDMVQHSHHCSISIKYQSGHEAHVGNKVQQHMLAKATSKAPRDPHLVSLPWQPAFQQEQECVGKRLQVISSAGRAAKVCMHTGIAHCASAAGPQHVESKVVILGKCAC